MQHDYALGPIRTGQIVPAFALLRAFNSQMNIERWQDITGQGRWTIIVATDCVGYVRGMTLSSACMHPIAHRLMEIPILIAGSVLDEKTIADLLFREAKRRAIVLRCNFMRIWTWSPDISDRLDDLPFYQRWNHGVMHCLTPAVVRPLDDN